jgi:1,4-alpha-glucan branching enzyme
VFNFHPTESFANYWIGVEWAGRFRYVMSTDDEVYGGFNRINTDIRPESVPEGYQGRRCKIELYIPSRTAFVLRRENA